jgi:hypothetical protein
MSAVEYKDFELLPCPYQLRNTNEWIVRVTIAKKNDNRGEIRKKPFCSKIYSESKHADYHAIMFGKEVIDGKHPNASVDNLY